MNSIRFLCKVILHKEYQAVERFRKFHLFPNLHLQLKSSLRINQNLDTSLFLTTLPRRRSGKKPKFKINKVPSGPLLISCKQNKLNHYQGMNYNQFECIPLASKGWYHRKSKGDYFTILPVFEHPAFISSRAEELPKTFTELEVRDDIIQELNKIGVYNPTVIQAKAISQLLNGKNVLITAETGCGKTLAYVIPLMQNILNLKERLPVEMNAPFGIILLPTKELAAQVGNIVTNLGKGLGLHCVTLISGDFENIQKDPSIEVTDVIVTTLGILFRYIRSKIYVTTRCKVLALDEADMFFEKEFFPELKHFFTLAKLNFIGLRNSILWPNAAQMCLTSATSVGKISEKFENAISMNHLETVATGYLHKVSFHIRQHFMRLNKRDKPEALLKILKANVKKRIPTVVFSNRTNTCDFLYFFLQEQGVESVKINGAMFSDVRIKGFMDFKLKKVFVLICTDCMSRGLDMTWVKQIVNYEFPNNIASYIHRCGRTGRLGYDEDCLVTNFVSGKNEIKFVNEIELAARAGRELTVKGRVLERPPEKKIKKRRKKKMKKKIKQ